MKHLLTKKLPTIFAFFSIFLGLGIGFFWAQKQKTTVSPSNKILPQSIMISNIQDNKLTISYQTSDLSLGQLKYGDDSSDLNLTAIDDRNRRSQEQQTYLLHYITIDGLKADKTYYFLIDGAAVFSSNTTPALTVTKENLTLSGRILNPNNTPAAEVLVKLTTTNMSPLTVLTDKNGLYTFFLDQTRTLDLSQSASLDVQATILNLEATDGLKKTKALILTKDALSKMPDLVLGHETYYFSQVPQQYLAEASVSAAPLIQIENPSFDNEEINTQKPNFFGKGPANATLKIKIESETDIQDEIQVDSQGKWTYSPPDKLEPGEHLITLNYTNEKGEQTTVWRPFIVLAAGETNLPAFTASESAKPTISPSPSPSLSPSPSPSPPTRVVQPPIEQKPPTTGTYLPTILLVTGAFLMLILSFIP